MATLPPLPLRFAAFVLVGGLCLDLNALALWALTSGLGIHYLLSTTIAFLGITPFGFFLNKVLPLMPLAAEQFGQFLVEAVPLSLIGGIAGILIGVGASLGIAQVAGWRILLSPKAVVLAVAFAFAIGVFFGFYPARKAAHLNPVEALRFE